jgi:hypothetical protein
VELAGRETSIRDRVRSSTSMPRRSNKVSRR